MKRINSPVAVTGMGIVSSIGHSVSDFTYSLQEGISGIGELTDLNAKLPFRCIGAGIKDFSYASAIKACSDCSQDIIDRALKFARRSPFSIQVSAAAAMEAFGQARANTDNVPVHKRGIVVAGSNINCNFQFGIYDKFNKSPDYISPSYALNFLDTDQVGTLSEIFDLKGEGFTVGGASASGNVALIKAMQLIWLGEVDFCMVIGALTDLSPAEFQGFHNLGAIGGKAFAHEPEKACRPFDSQHEGFIYGQAGACIILESLESAVKRGANILAKMAGGSIKLHGSRLSEPNEQAEITVMEEAMAKAGIDAGKLDYINAHATSTPLGDITELAAIKKVTGEHVSNIWLNSTKSLTGHCLYSAGVVEAIASIVQMQNSFVHPNLNLDCPIDTGFRFSGPKTENAVINVAMSNSFGFGGINTSLIIEKGA